MQGVRLGRDGGRMETVGRMGWRDGGRVMVEGGGWRVGIEVG